MIAWISAKLGLSAIVTELILGGVVVGAVLFGLRLWGNKQWAAGELKGRENVAADVVKAHQAEWDAKEKSLAVEAATLAADRRTIDVQASEIAAARASQQAALVKIIDAAKQRQDQSHAQVIAVPADELDSALRILSADLAASH